MIALIPARAGSRRVPGKNVRPLGGHPLLAYTVGAAIQSGIFKTVLVSTDSGLYAEIARYYGAEVPFLRPKRFAGTASPDFAWLQYTLRRLRKNGSIYDCYAILRPTSPFRQVETLIRAWRIFKAEAFRIDSLRAVEKCRQHPGKMWILKNNRIFPLLPFCTESGQPWHSTPYQALPEIFVQNASLEIAWTRVLEETGTISGRRVLPFFTEGLEGFDINDERDWKTAEDLIKEGKTTLPRITQSPY